MGGCNNFSSSSSSSSHMRTGIEGEKTGMGGAPQFLCHCGVEAPIVTSWSGESPGRKFYGCGLYKVYGRRVCKFFVWCDQVDSEEKREKKLIAGFFKKFEAMKKKERVLEISLGICIVMIIMLVIAYLIRSLLP